MTTTLEQNHDTYPAAPEQDFGSEVLADLDSQMERYLHDPDMHELMRAVAEERNTAVAKENELAMEQGTALGEYIELPDLDSPDLDEETFMRAAQAAFDFRKGAGRNAIDGGQMSERTETALATIVEKMKQKQDTEPTNPDFDVAFVLGGAGITPKVRLDYLIELIEAGKVDTDLIVLIGSGRPLGGPVLNKDGSVKMPSERDRAQGAGYDKNGVPAVDEFDLLCNTAANKFNLEPNDWMKVNGVDRNLSVNGTEFESKWRVISAELPNGKHVMVVSAPMLDEQRYHPDGKPRKEANTQDGYLMVCEMLRDHAEPGKQLRALSVTDAIFVPFQGADAAGTLAAPYNVQSETVGFTREHSGRPEWPGGSKLYIQEVLSALRRTRANRDSLRQRLQYVAAA